MNPSAPRSAGFELRHLRSFVAVAEELHFGRAAIRLGIAQPPLSQQIQQLERHLDTALFERTSRQVRLTDAGVVFLAEARRILLAVEQAAASARRAARGETGELKVAFAATVMFLALPHILRTFRARFPDVRLDLREMATGSQLAAIKNGDLDIGFVREPLPDPDLDTQVVFREPLRITVDSAHPLAQKKHVRVADLANEPFVLFPSEIAPGLHSQVMKLCRDAGFSPRVVEISRELYTTVSLVEAGVGVSILPASVERLGWSGVRYLPLPAKTPMTRVAASWRRDRVRPVLSALLAIAHETSRETASDAQEEIVASSPTNVRANKERRR